MTTQPEALRLAEVSPYLEGGERGQWIIDAAAELRRLYEAHEWQYKMAGERLRRIEKLEAQRDALLEALLRIESAVDWYLGRSSFTQTTQLKGLKHSANVRKELFAAHDEVRAAIKAVEGENHAKSL